MPFSILINHVTNKIQIFPAYGKSLTSAYYLPSLGKCLSGDVVSVINNEGIKTSRGHSVFLREKATTLKYGLKLNNLEYLTRK